MKLLTQMAKRTKLTLEKPKRRGTSMSKKRKVLHGDFLVPDMKGTQGKALMAITSPSLLQSMKKQERKQRRA